MHMDAEIVEINCEKYKELYLLSKEILQEEDKRNSYIEAKAGRYVTSLIILFGGLGFFGKWVIKELFPICSIFETIITVLLIATAATIFFGVIIIYLILKQKDYLVRNVDVEFFDKNDLPTVYRELAIENRNATKINRDVNNIKSKLLGKVHLLTLASMVMFLLLVTLFAIYSAIYIS